MTDTNVNTSPADDDDDGLFDAAQDTFPSKFDLRDRLVVIYPDGDSGQRPGNDGKPYTWYSSTTVVLDDGPDGWRDMVPGEGGELQPNLVPSVAEEGLQVLTKFQWSAGGISARMAQKLPNAETGVPGSILGRINVIRNDKKGMSPPWGIAKPTEADMELARSHRDVLARARAAITAAQQAKKDADAF